MHKNLSPLARPNQATTFSLILSLWLLPVAQVIPMSTFTKLKYVPQVTCPECQSWIKETARRCPMCGQQVCHVSGDDGDGGGGGGAGGRTADDDAVEEPAGHKGRRHRAFGRLWSSATR